jgi:hypothetical protein
MIPRGARKTGGSRLSCARARDDRIAFAVAGCEERVAKEDARPDTRGVACVPFTRDTDGLAELFGLIKEGGGPASCRFGVSLVTTVTTNGADSARPRHPQNCDQENLS